MVEAVLDESLLFLRENGFFHAKLGPLEQPARTTSAPVARTPWIDLNRISKSPLHGNGENAWPAVARRLTIDRRRCTRCCKSTWVASPEISGRTRFSGAGLNGKRQPPVLVLRTADSENLIHFYAALRARAVRGEKEKAAWRSQRR